MLVALVSADAAVPAEVAAVRAQLEQAALTQAGDVDRGRRVYERAELRCGACHRCDDEQAAARKHGEIGPNLSTIGIKLDRPHLADSLLWPSHEIGYGYRTSVLRLDDGRVLAGLIKNRNETTLDLVDTQGRATAIEVAAIEAERGSDVSIMPAGMFDAHPPGDFVDLVAYLESRGGVSGQTKFGAGISGPVSLPEGWTIRTIATGLDGAVAMERLPDGRVLICEQPGRVRVIKDDRLLPTPLMTLEVESYWERGVIGVAAEPNFARDPWVYVCHVKAEPYPHHRISRFRVSGDTADPASEEILLEGDDQRQYKGQVLAGHQGGGMHFGPDGCLYIGMGEHTAGQPAQRLDTLLGKILRINRDGSIPPDNPLLDRTEGKYRAIWAYGCRNPFSFAFRDDGLLFINDVGGKFEEVNRGRPGANYGWPGRDHGPIDDPAKLPGITGPVHWYPQASIAGGDFAPPTAGEFAGQYVYGDFNKGGLYALDPDAATSGGTPAFTTIATGLRRPVDVRFAPDGSLDVLLRNAWIMDDKFVGDTGALVRLSPPAAVAQTAATAATVDDRTAAKPTNDGDDDAPFVRLTRRSEGGRSLFRIDTPAATYGFDADTGGLAALFDRDSRDWIGHDPASGTAETGEYRGWPNAVYRPPLPGLFHPANDKTAAVAVEVVSETPQHVAISATSDDGWSGRYDITPESMTFTVLAMPEGAAYWCLFEGAPGGAIDTGDWWMTADERGPLSQPREGDLPNTDGCEWFAMGDPACSQALLLTSDHLDEAADRYYPMGDLQARGEAMTVFGFGRGNSDGRGVDRLLTRPARFTLSLVDVGYDASEATARQVLRAAAGRRSAR